MNGWHQNESGVFVPDLQPEPAPPPESPGAVCAVCATPVPPGTRYLNGGKWTCREWACKHISWTCRACATSAPHDPHCPTCGFFQDTWKTS